MYTKLVPQTVYAQYKFHIKIYLESFESIYHSSIFQNLNITLNYGFISKTINIRGNLIWKCPLVPGIPVVWQRFSFFSVMTIFEVSSCIFVLNSFDCSNSLLPSLFLLHHYIRRYIITQCVTREAMNNTHRDKMIIPDKLNLIYFDCFDLFWLIIIASYYTHSFLSP